MYHVAALYHFTPLSDLVALQSSLKSLCAKEGIKGTLLIAKEDQLQR